MIRLGVCGWPVAHSRSPQMHEAALRACGLRDWHYLRLPLPPELFAETVAALPATGFRGVNVTIPHKEAALALADEASEAALAIGAANTLTFEDGRILAENTDAPGFLDALPGDRDLRGARALVLGAGGSARAVVWALRQAGAAEVLIWNRTPGRAEALAAELGARAVAASEVLEAPELVVNCTSVGLAGELAPFKALPLQADDLGAGSLVVDLVYRDGGTRFLEAARTRGADVVDGLEILVAQGAASFERWTGMVAPRTVMREAAGNSSSI
ncbi:MAG TPA: shikimate dehydrogenase [Solirubrobacteraceae bacterium]|nr:shikimate dehydrogenase [Solirubrobacteraceae bacterium]